MSNTPARFQHLFRAFLTIVVLAATPANAQEAKSKPLLDFGRDFAAQGITSTSSAVTINKVQGGGGPALLVTIPPGNEAYPGIDIAQQLNLSAYGRVDVKLFNPGDKKFRVNVCVDNDGDWHLNPWNAEIATLLPGKSTTVTVYFGRSYGNAGYALNPAAVTHLKMTAGKSADAQAFRVESIVAAGHPGEAPPIDPATLRVKPVDGLLFGKGIAFDPKSQLSTTGGAKAISSADGSGVEASFSGARQAVLLKPAMGRWDLREGMEVRLKLKNMGKSPMTPNGIVNSNDGPTDAFTVATPLVPGEERTLSVSFIPVKPWVAKPASSPQSELWNGVAGTGSSFASDKVTSVALGSESGAGSLLIESVSLAASPARVPDWLGKRPPVEGEWVQTFDDEFNGNAIDATKWNVHGDNYYDKRSHYSKDQVFVSNGIARLRYEKKTGFQNDDPAQKQTEYATGFLENFGKWSQRYGYFEARMKLPTAPGLWPGFWLMPDRGPAAGDRHKRDDTHDGGMEIDMMEFLSRWGIYRYNIALHWDGYNAGHRQTGNTKTYVQPDKDGFVTSGVLWTPGLLVFYCNGKEVSRFEDPRVPSVPEQILFTYPSGGWDNDQLEDKKLPADFLIDYVRVWQRKDLATPTEHAAK